MAKQTDITEVWRLYQAGKDYNYKLDLYNTVDKLEKFYAGDQWSGVNAGNLDTPVFNIFKRIINYFIAAIMSQNIKMQFVPELIGDEPAEGEEADIAQLADMISSYSENLWEKLKMNNQMRQALLDAALSGDAGNYSFWNPKVKTGQIAEGDIDAELIDNVNVFFGNPNDRRINHNGYPIQPYIVIAFRQMVKDLRAEAKANGVPKDKIELITADLDTYEQSGDRGKIELEQDSQDSAGKAIALLYLYPDGGTIKAVKATKFVEVRKEWDTKLSIYPVAWMNWDVRKNSYHGQAIGTGLIPNQIFINKAFAMVMLWLRQIGIPKVIYDKNRIPFWSNKIGEAIGVESVDGSIDSVAKYMVPSQLSEMVIKVIDLAIQYTKDMLGASDAAMGDVKPDNTSAIIAVQQAASIPLENIKQNLYQFAEDMGYIWLDFMANYYGKRKVLVKVNGKKVVQEIDFSRLKTLKMRIKIDVGPSSYWSEITAMQTLDNLLQNDKITFIQYLDRVPNGIIPKKQELLDELKEQMQMQEQMMAEQQMQEQQMQEQQPQDEYDQMAQFIATLPPDMQEQLMALPQEEMMAAVAQIQGSQV